MSLRIIRSGVRLTNSYMNSNKHHVDIKKAAGTGISFASGGALVGSEIAGLIGSLIFAVVLGIIGIWLVSMLFNRSK